MPPAERREYSGIAPPTTLSAGIANNSTSISITNSTGWPTGAVGPFFAVIDRGLPTEEKVKFSARAGAVLTVATSGRGQDGTGAASHNAGATIEHVVTADDMNLANQHAADATLDHHTQYLTEGRHDVAARHTPISLGYAMFSPGDMKISAIASDHAGWLLCDGREVATATYPNLAFLGTTFGASGAGNVRLPDFRGRAPIGAGPGTGLTNRAVGASFGAETVTLAAAHMPSHSHTINEHTHAGTTGDHDRTHYHGLENHNHYVPGVGDHQHIVNAGGHEVAFNYGPGANGKLSTAGNAEGLTFSDINPAGGHDHGYTHGSANAGGWQGANTGHLHPFTTGGASNRGTDAQGSGTAMGIMNPHLAVNVFIKT